MQFTPMSGENLLDYPDSVLDGKLWRMSEKVDGVRRLFHKAPDGSVTAWSRTGKKDEWLGHITEFLESPWFPSGTVYDCELVDREYYLKNTRSFVLRQVSSAKASQQYVENKKDLIAVCFDIFRTGGDTRRGQERDSELYSLFNGGNRSDPVLRVPVFGNIRGADRDSLNKVLDEVLSRGGEGLMLLDMDSVYIPGRSKACFKVKRIQEFVGRVIDIEMARAGTKIEGMVAKVICEVPGCTVPVKVGSGFNNEERLDMTINSPVGKYIEIEAFGYSQNKSGTISLSLPIFKRFVAI